MVWVFWLYSKGLAVFRDKGRGPVKCTAEILKAELLNKSVYIHKQEE